LSRRRCHFLLNLLFETVHQSSTRAFNAFPHQRLTRQQALQTYTVNNAYAAVEENIKGTLTPGKLADITIFSQDIMTIPEEKILNTNIVYTIIGGEVKYQKT
jgi:predicted amidohydrolase YtcJ